MFTYSVGLYTLGCKVSQYETQAIAECFEKLGFIVFDFDDICDVYVVNTCTVTSESDRKSRQIIRRAIQKNPDAVVMVCGCFAQTSPEEIAKIDGVSYICGTNGKSRMAEKAKELLENRSNITVTEVGSLIGSPFEHMKITRAPRTRAYVKIEDGCDCKCSYCAIPGARGSVRSKPAQDILSEINMLAQSGTKEVVLTGIEAASYGADLNGYKLIDLLEDVEEAGMVERIRLGSLTPEIMRPEFIDRISKLRKVAPHFHLSMQSGCDRTLANMKRRYNTRMALNSMEKLREQISGVMFTTDIMVGFPGESDEDFSDTLKFTEQARFLDMHIFAYSRRKNTEADLYPCQIAENVKHERSVRLSELRDRISKEILSEVVKEQRKLSVVFETCEDGVWTGHSAEYIRVLAPATGGGNLHGEIRTVMPEFTKNKSIKGKII